MPPYRQDSKTRSPGSNRFSKPSRTGRDRFVDIDPQGQRRSPPSMDSTFRTTLPGVFDSPGSGGQLGGLATSPSNGSSSLQWASPVFAEEPHHGTATQHERDAQPATGPHARDETLKMLKEGEWERGSGGVSEHTQPLSRSPFSQRRRKCIPKLVRKRSSTDGGSPCRSNRPCFRVLPVHDEALFVACELHGPFRNNSAALSSGSTHGTPQDTSLQTGGIFDLPNNWTSESTSPSTSCTCVMQGTVFSNMAEQSVDQKDQMLRVDSLSQSQEVTEAAPQVTLKDDDKESQPRKKAPGGLVIDTSQKSSPFNLMSGFDVLEGQERKAKEAGSGNDGPTGFTFPVTPQSEDEPEPPLFNSFLSFDSKLSWGGLGSFGSLSLEDGGSNAGDAPAHGSRPWTPTEAPTRGSAHDPLDATGDEPESQDLGDTLRPKREEHQLFSPFPPKTGNRQSSRLPSSDALEGATGIGPQEDPLAPESSQAEEAGVSESIREPSETEFSAGSFPEIRYSEDLIDDTYDVINLRVYHRRGGTGFESTKDLQVRPGQVIAGRYQVASELDTAAFSFAVSAVDLKDNTSVCLKIIKNNKDYFDQSLDEIKLLRMINTNDPKDEAGIVRMHDFFYYKEHLIIVFELLEDNLYALHRKCVKMGLPTYFTLPRIQSIAKQVLRAAAFLHSLNILHADLKPENILIQSLKPCSVKVIDLGSSCFTTDHLGSYIQSRAYRAPEVILGMPYREKIDVWSIGCILAELAAGYALFQSDYASGVLACIESAMGPVPAWMHAEGKYSANYYTRSGRIYHQNPSTQQYEILQPVQSNLSSCLETDDAGFLGFLSSLLVVDPAERPSAKEALRHPWLHLQLDASENTSAEWL